MSLTGPFTSLLELLARLFVSGKQNKKGKKCAFCGFAAEYRFRMNLHQPFCEEAFNRMSFKRKNRLQRYAKDHPHLCCVCKKRVYELKNKSKGFYCSQCGAYNLY